MNTQTTKINMGIIGFGLFAEAQLLPAFQKSKLTRLVAITKRKAEDAAKKATQYKIQHSFDYENKAQMLADPTLDAVFIATPNSLHKQDTIDALQAGKHVLLEKPMALNAQECQEMIAIANQTGKKLMVAQSMRFLTIIDHFRTVIEAGEIGSVISITADFFSTGIKSSRPWKYDKTLAGGGAAFDLGVHLVDLIRFLANSPLISTQLVKKPHTLKEGEVDVLSSFLMEFENGIVGRATASYEGSRNTFIEIFGTEGYIRAYDWNMPYAKVRVEQWKNETNETYIIENGNAYTAEIDSFARAILHDETPPVPGEEGLINQRIIDLVYK